MGAYPDHTNMDKCFAAKLKCEWVFPQCPTCNGTLRAKIFRKGEWVEIFNPDDGPGGEWFPAKYNGFNSEYYHTYFRFRTDFNKTQNKTKYDEMTLTDSRYDIRPAVGVTVKNAGSTVSVGAVANGFYHRKEGPPIKLNTRKGGEIGCPMCDGTGWKNFKNGKNGWYENIVERVPSGSCHACGPTGRPDYTLPSWANIKYHYEKPDGTAFIHRFKTGPDQRKDGSMTYEWFITLSDNKKNFYTCHGPSPTIPPQKKHDGKGWNVVYPSEFQKGFYGRFIAEVGDSETLVFSDPELQS